MDKKTIIGLVVIVGILIGFNLFNKPSAEEILAQEDARKEALHIQDSLARIESLVDTESIHLTDSAGVVILDSSGHAIVDTAAMKVAEIAKTNKIANTSTKIDTASTIYKLAVATNPRVNPVRDSVEFKKIYDSLLTADYERQYQEKLTENVNSRFGIFAPSGIEKDKEYFFIENDKVRLKISSKGGQIAEAHVKGFLSYGDYTDSVEIAEQDRSIQLFDEDSTSQNLRLSPSSTKDFLNSTDLNFVVTESTSSSIKLRATTTSADKNLEYHYSLEDGYVVNYDINLVGLDDELLGNDIGFKWTMKGLSTEKLASQERIICGIFYKCIGDSRDYLGETSSDLETDFDTNIEWIAFKHNYFTSMLYLDGGFNKGNSELEVVIDENSTKYTKQYMADVSISVPLGSRTTIPMKMYFGPNDMKELGALNMEAEDIVNLGPSIFRAVNKWFIIPIFNILQSSGMGYGLIIILMTLIIKVVILPLTYKNYKSSAKMRILKPEITKINEKYPDKADAMKKQQETMALYKKSGASPMAGCIPMLIQMPILFAAFRFFPSSMDLRQQSFLWAEALSAFDSIYNFGFNIPMYGDHISLFTVLMCISTIFYTKMNSGQMQASGPGMPNMKVIMYLFPIMMLFFFNNFGAGLSLYYLCGNLMNMGLMWMVKKYFIDENKLKLQMASKAKKPKKQSKFQARLANVAKQQQLKQAKK
ncbi:MAG: membrane protein insertase YidC [Flavobacteriales bacterium]|nr:membrane protein insertase YidC [Flavobacteriales bacterium]